MTHPKNTLIDLCKSLGLPKPKFQTKRSGPEHDPTFVCDVLIKAEVYGTGQGSNKREAERRASEEALARLEPNKPAPKKPKKSKDATSATAEAVEENFEGPWPIFAEVLAASLEVANSRVSAELKGSEAVREVQRLALELYKGSLENLGEIIEVEIKE